MDGMIKKVYIVVGTNLYEEGFEILGVYANVEEATKRRDDVKQHGYHWVMGDSTVSQRLRTIHSAGYAGVTWFDNVDVEIHMVK